MLKFFFGNFSLENYAWRPWWYITWDEKLKRKWNYSPMYAVISWRVQTVKMIKISLMRKISMHVSWFLYMSRRSCQPCSNAAMCNRNVATKYARVLGDGVNLLATNCSSRCTTIPDFFYLCQFELEDESAHFGGCRMHDWGCGLLEALQVIWRKDEISLFPPRENLVSLLPKQPWKG